MSDEMKNCCPPETKAPKMHAHDATEKTEDIKPKVITTAHKRLSQDEFQRKVAMAARAKVAADMEKEAIISSVGAALSGIGKLPQMVRAYRAAAPLARMGGAMGQAAQKGYGMTNPVAKTVEGLKSLWRTGMLPGAQKSWMNAPVRGAIDYGKYLLNPRGLIAPAAAAVTGAGAAAMPYVGGALQRAGAAFGGTVGATTGGGNPNTGFGNIANLGMLGAGIGGVAGAMMPGEEEYEDEDGRIRKRRGSMLAGALRGAGLGGLAGGAGGAAMDYFGKTSSEKGIVNMNAFQFGAMVANHEKRAVGPALNLMNQGVRAGMSGLRAGANAASKFVAGPGSMTDPETYKNLVGVGTRPSTLVQQAQNIPTAIQNAGRSMGRLTGQLSGNTKSMSGPASRWSRPAYTPGLPPLDVSAGRDGSGTGGNPGYAGVQRFMKDNPFYDHASLFQGETPKIPNTWSVGPAARVPTGKLQGFGD